MSFNLTHTVTATAEQAHRLSQLLATAFIADADQELAYLERVGFDHLRLVWHGSDLAGGLATLPIGQWFGGQCVPMVGIASVAIAPHYRSRGVAQTLMQHTLADLHQQGVALSTLYPAAQGLYRKVGYGQAGTYCTWGIDPHRIGISKPQLEIRLCQGDVRAQIQALYQRQAKQNDGCLDRRVLWQALFNPVSGQLPTIYTVGPVDQPEGYVCLRQDRVTSGPRLTVQDWAALTPAAAQSLWAFLASHRSQIEDIRWHGGILDAMTHVLPEQTAKMLEVDRWMTRIVHLEAALSQRGYPPRVMADLHLAVRDDLLPDNNGTFVLTVAHGQGSVKAGGRGDLAIHIRDLATLYTGLWSAQQLYHMGVLTGSETAIDLAQTLFSGGSPWMADFF